MLSALQQARAALALAVGIVAAGAPTPSGAATHAYLGGASNVAAPDGGPQDDGARYVTWRDSRGRLVRYDDRTGRIARWTICPGGKLDQFLGTGFGITIARCVDATTSLTVDLRTGVSRPAVGVRTSDGIVAVGRYWLRGLPPFAGLSQAFVNRSTGERRLMTQDSDWFLRDLDRRDLAPIDRTSADAVPSVTLPAVLRRPDRFLIPRDGRRRGLRRTCRPACEYVRVTSRHIAWSERRPRGVAAIYVFDRRTGDQRRLVVPAPPSPNSTEVTAWPLLTRYGAFVVLANDSPPDSANQIGSVRRSYELYRVRR